MDKKFFITIGAVAIMAISFVACQKGAKLTVLGEASSNLKAMEALKNNYEKENNLKIEFFSYSLEDALTKSNQDFANGTGLYDIVLQYNFSLSSFVRNNYVYNIDTLMKGLNVDVSFEKDLFPNAWYEVGYYYKDPNNPQEAEIQKIGYPFATNTMLLVYNKKMFENQQNKADYKQKYGEDLVVPATWQQYKQLAEFFTKNGTYGVCMQGATGSWLYYEYCDFLYGMGAKIFDKEYGWQGTISTPVTIASPEAVTATEFYRSLKPFNKGNYLTIDANEQIKLLQQGDVAMAFVWSDYLYDFVYDNNGSQNVNFGFAPIPGEKSPLAGGCFYVNRKSAHSQEAIKYIMNIMQPKTQIELAKKGLCSPLKSTYEDAEVRQMPYSEALKNSLQRGVYMFEAGIESQIVSDVITKHIQRLWQNDNLKVEDVLNQIQQEIIKERAEAYKNL
jgi:multiple sugar transport system substrate-binding protein